MISAPFIYNLPKERIAQRPVHPCDAARLLVADREHSEVSDSTFSNLGAFLRAGDLLVFNDSKVLPARLLGRLESGGEVEVLLHRRQAGEKWRCLGRPLKKFKPGKVLLFQLELCARIGERVSEYEVEIEFFSTSQAAAVSDLLNRCGSMPVPPYIRAGKGDESDRVDYQSIFARVDGSVAAPTASLHFTPGLLENLISAGVQTASLTLHVGAASFLPVYEDGRPVRLPGPEAFIYDAGLLDRCAAVRRSAGRVIAVGTTVVRALESMAAEPGTGGAAMETELFISPGYEFKLVDCLVTNFHQPGTTHLLLVEAFMGRGLLSHSYEYALSHDFRFLSYGDGMLIV